MKRGDEILLRYRLRPRRRRGRRGGGGRIVGVGRGNLGADEVSDFGAFDEDLGGFGLPVLAVALDGAEAGVEAAGFAAVYGGFVGVGFLE